MSNSILPAAGNLDIVNANVRADKFNAATNIGVANTNPDFNFSVGDKFHVDKDSTDPVSITGNVVASGIKISNLTIGPAFDFASVSNVGNVTANVIQFANATTGFTTTANVEIGGNIALTSNAQVTIGSNVLVEYTGPHPREPKEMPLKKFPEIVFDASKYDQNHSTNTYVQAGYTVTASSQAADAKNAANLYNEQFPLTDVFTGWQGLDGAYNSSRDATSIDTLTGITGATSSRNGSYTTLELPHKIKLSYLQIHTRNSVDHSNLGHPKQIYVYGSNDGSSWTQIGSHLFTATPSSPIWQKIDINSATPYNYFALQATSILDTTGRLSLLDLEWYGYEEPAPPGDLSLDTTLKSTFNSVRSNNYVMYFDGKDPDGTDPKNLVSGSSISLTNNNATYDASNDYWTLDGSTESNVTTGSLGFEGDAPHTVSMWVNSSNLDANALTQQLFSIGSGYDKSFLRVDDTQIAANTWHNVTYAYQGEGGSKVTYVDGRKVEEARVEDTFGDYPPFPMTGYSQGGYVVSATAESIDGTYNSYEAFNGVINDNTALDAWQPNYNIGGDFDTSGNATTQTQFNPGGGASLVNGPALLIQFPHRVKITSYDVYARRSNDVTYGFANKPKSGRIYGSNDGLTWTQIDSFGDWTTWVANTPQTEVITTPGAYNRYAMVVESMIYQSQTWVAIGEWKLYGHKEGDLTRFPEPTRVLKYPHVNFGNEPARRGYVISASGEYLNGGDSNHRMWRPFQDPLSGDGSWLTDDSPATFDNASPDSAATNANSLSGIVGVSGSRNGPWLKLELPHKIKFSYAHIYKRNHPSLNPGIKTGFIYGSNDDSTWTTIGTINESSPSYTTTTPLIVTSTDTTNAYKYIVLQVTLMDQQNIVFGLGRLKYYGTQEDTGTPAIVGGPFAGKVANFRVYDQYLGDERIQEIYDAQKDEFGHKKSSMTFYKGRIGVGTTEPEGALTVVDEPHTLAKFPARAVSADESYVEGDGQIKLSAVEGSGYQAFDGLTSTSWTATPERHARLSEEVDFGAWLKIQTPESMSLKKAEFESNPDWRQVGDTINDSAEHAANSSAFGMALDCTDDGTRIIVGAYLADPDSNSNRGQAFVFDWNGSGWVRVGNVFEGTQNGEQLGYAVAISGDGKYVAVGSNLYHDGSTVDVGRYAVFYLNGSTWTLVPDSGPLTSTLQNYFLGNSTNDRAGWSLSLSYDGKTIAAGYRQLVSGAGGEAGQIRVHTYANGAWTQKGQNLNGLESDDRLGQSVKITPDGNHLIAGAIYGSVSAVYVYDYNSSSSQWVKRTTLTHPTLPSTNTHYYGTGIAISDDGNTVAVGASLDDTDGTNYGRVYVYTWSGSAWTLVSTLVSPLQGTDNENFGSAVDLSGDGTRLVAAASLENNGQGYAFTYEYTGGTWQLRNHTTSGSAGVSTDGHLGEFYTGLIISRDGSTIVGGDRAGNEGKVRVWNMPSNIKSIWGSNDDVNWTKITTGNETFRVSDRLEFKNLDNPNYYKYHAIVADAFTRLKDVKLFGVRKQGSSTLHDGALTLTKTWMFPGSGHHRMRTIHPVGTDSSWNTTPTRTLWKMGWCETPRGGGMMVFLEVRRRMMRRRRRST
jgi:hypothetical protein